MPLLSNDVWRERLPRSIESSCAESSFELVAFVYMPEHLHLLVYPKTREPKIGRFLARLKQPFSKEIKRILINSRSSLLDKLTVRERPGKHCFRFWQEGPGFDRNVYPPKFFKHLSTTFTTPRPSVDSAIEPSIGNGPVLGIICWNRQRNNSKRFLLSTEFRWEHLTRGNNHNRKPKQIAIQKATGKASDSPL